MNKPNALIIGGTSGLGLELGLNLSFDYHVSVTGRHKHDDDFTFYPLDLTSEKLPNKLDELFQKLQTVDLLVYAAGYFQEGTISDLKDNEIEEMISVGLIAPSLILQRLLKKQNKLQGFIAITSTSQWTPRKLEPVYTAVKSGLGMLANSVSLDDKIGKVLVAGPAGMRTKFWNKNPRDTTTYLEPKWVADQISKEYEGNYEYKYIRILREPKRVEAVENR